MKFIYGLLTIGALAIPIAHAESSNSRPTSGEYCFNGYAYAENGKTLLYTEHHEQTLKDGRPQTWTVSYRSANAEIMAAEPGEVIARKKFDFSNNPTVPVYTLDLLREGYREGIRHDASKGDKGWRMIKRASKDASTETEDFKYDPPMAADSGFDPFVKENFKALMAGETVKFDFVAAGRLGVVGLRAYKVGETEFEGQPAVKFKAELGSLFRFVVDVSIEMTYDPKSKKLLQYQGVSNMHNAARDTFPVVIKYLDEAPSSAQNSKTPKGCSHDS